MEKISEFKEFIRKNPNLIKYVKNNEMTWQKFYEIYDIYGEEENAWSEYLKEAKIENTSVPSALTAAELVAFLKRLNLDNLQEGISSVQRVVGMLNDMIVKKNDTTISEYKPRPLYKHFDD